MSAEPLRDAMLRHAVNLERYPFESATMAEAGRLAANAIRSAVREVHGDEGETLYEALSASAGYLRNAAIDLETGAPKATALRTINGGLKRVEAALAIAMEARSGETACGLDPKDDSAGRQASPNPKDDPTGVSI
jgi:hypothetical protein